MKKTITIFGCGKTATDFYQNHKHQIDVSGVLSNNIKEQEFLPESGVSFTVNRPQPKNKKNEYIVICSSSYETIAEQLVLLGYTPFEDFVDYETAILMIEEKSLVLLYGFCHLRGIRDCLLQSEEFTQSYLAVYYSNYLSYSAYQQAKLNYLIERCKVLIYGMAVSPENHCKNEAILGRLRPDVKKLCIHAVYFGAYFPQKKREYNALNTYAVKCDGQEHTPFSYGDSWLNECINQGMSTDDILSSIETKNIYDKDFVLAYLQNEWKRLRFQEKQSDFYIVNFIEQHYRDRRLFRNEAHMENEILYQYAMQVLNYLNCRNDMGLPQEPLLKCTQHIIFPCVAKVLELKWDVLQEELELFTYNGWKKISAIEYVREYVEVCRDIKKLKQTYFLP